MRWALLDLVHRNPVLTGCLGAEIDGFLKALDENEILIPFCKKRVRARINAWYEKDAGVGP